MKNFESSKNVNINASKKSGYNKNGKAFHKSKSNNKVPTKKSSGKKFDFPLSVIYPWSDMVTAYLNNRVHRGHKCSFNEGDVVTVMPRPAIFGESGMTHVPAFTAVRKITADNGIKFERTVLFADEVTVVIGEDEIPGEVFLESKFAPECASTSMICNQVEVAVV